MTGSIFRILDSNDFGVLSSFRTDAKYLGGALFEKSGVVLSYDEERGLVPAKMRTASGETSYNLCDEAVLDAGKVLCPKNGIVLLPHETTLKDRFFWSSGRAVRTETETLRVQGGREISSEKVLTLTGAKPGNVVRLARTQYRLFGGELVPMGEDGAVGDPLKLAPLSSVAAVHEFGHESVILGYAGEDAAFVLVDERGNRYPAVIGRSKLSDIRIENFHGAYLVSDGKALYLYHKAAKELTKLVDGKVLGIFDSTVLFEKEGQNYRLDLVAGE